MKAGFQPPEKEEVDPLLKALKDNKDLLPKAVRVRWTTTMGRS